MEGGYRKYAWILVLAGGLLDVYGVLSYNAQNRWVLTFPSYVFGFTVLIGGILQIILGPTLFRKGATLGWFLVLLSGLFALANGVYDSVAAFWLLGILLFIYYGGPAWLALGLTYRRFFPEGNMMAR